MSDARESICPLCGFSGPFRPFGIVPRPEAQCPQCRSMERHRFLWFLLVAHGHLKHPWRSVLHVAAEPCLVPHLRRVWGERYLTADLEPGRDVVVDLQDPPPDLGPFDLLVALHVLEHVPNDRAALRSIRRLVLPGGTAILQVPIRGMVTDETPCATVETQTRVHGHPGHVRTYGQDFADRLREAGFEVEPVTPQALLGAERARLYRCSTEEIHVCR